MAARSSAALHLKLPGPNARLGNAVADSLDGKIAALAIGCHERVAGLKETHGLRSISTGHSNGPIVPSVRMNSLLRAASRLRQSSHTRPPTVSTAPGSSVIHRWQPRHVARVST